MPHTTTTVDWRHYVLSYLDTWNSLPTFSEQGLVGFRSGFAVETD